MEELCQQESTEVISTHIDKYPILTININAVDLYPEIYMYLNKLDSISLKTNIEYNLTMVSIKFRTRDLTIDPILWMVDKLAFIDRTFNGSRRGVFGLSDNKMDWINFINAALLVNNTETFVIGMKRKVAELWAMAKECGE